MNTAIETPNLDAMIQGELMNFWLKYRGGRNYRDFRPQGGKGSITAVAALAHYAANKSTAMRCRLSGDITAAMIYEDICDKIYNTLPEWAIW